ncbi:hypothetical protein [Bradyrhizobium sp. USDA 3650]
MILFGHLIPSHDVVVPLLIDILLTALLLQPLNHFVVHEWRRKQEEVNNSLDTQAKRTYLAVFWNRAPEAATVDPVIETKSDVDAEFDELYQRWYGRRRFIAPIIILVVIAALQNFYLGVKLVALVWDGEELGGATAAIAGAYTFVTWDLFSRVQQRNLARADILRNALRLAVAVPVGYAFGSLLQKGLVPFIAFAMGVFPISTIGTILRRLANDKLGLGLGADTAPDQVTALSGVDRSIADRIEDADITTIPQLAWCDPIQLSVRANLGFDFVVDIVSQALAWVYLTDKLPALRPLGLRGAFEMKVLADDLASNVAGIKAKAEAVLPLAATAANIPLHGFEYALSQIAGDPATRFLYDASTSSAPVSRSDS